MNEMMMKLEGAMKKAPRDSKIVRAHHPNKLAGLH
jgi:hypothetical protein